MGILLPRMLHAKQYLRRPNLTSIAKDVPKSHLPVFVVENQTMKKRHVVPLSFLNHPRFQQLLIKAEEEFGYDHPTGELTIPCNEDMLINLTSCLAYS
ncbi:hypothetical protein AQUCO_00700441v1 [Aquilegia coerulea]|uniref:Uncharacterized protein n=1 Tax=Aquilegia coerulea TaxID=218851 RepID=A0A2G5EK24_AQUCA|nr:hypothetical protein AQUCO_00700441v1 [Aquilegia coerulea]